MSLGRRHLLRYGAGAAAGAAAPGLLRAQAPAEPKPAPPLDLGGRLFSHVQAYSKWPQHRTGSDEAMATLDWFEAALRERGASTTRWGYDFPRYEWRARLEVGGRSVEAIPLWFEGDGEIATDEPFVRPVTLPGNYDKRDVELALREAKANKARLAVLPTFGTFGDAQRWPALIACNADPDAVRSDIPTLLVSGRELEALANGEVHAVMSAKRVPAQSPNVIARFGRDASPLLITTPLTGWFTCAGERGSGIAVAIELAAMLAQDEAVTVIGTTGHELENFGLRRQLESGLGFTPRAVVHIGASLAAGSRAADGKLEPSPFRFAAATRPMVEGSDLHQALHAGGFAAAPRMLGEGAEWAKALGPDVPLLSFSGTFQHFHTPADLPEASTAPALLAQAFTAVRDAAKALQS
jgi:hypothetical protein